MEGLQRAEVEIEGRGGAICYNGVSGVGEFASKMLELEAEMWPVLEGLLEGEQAKGMYGRLIQGYAEILEDVLNICGAGKMPHLYLHVHKNGRQRRWEQLSRHEQEEVGAFVRVQQGSFLRNLPALGENRRVLG